VKRLPAILGLLLPAICCAQQYFIRWHKIAGGGGASTDLVYTVKGTIGQSDAGKMSGNDFWLQGGFWAALAIGPVPGAPSFNLQQTATNTIVITWPITAGNWVLQERAAGAFATWSNVSVPAVSVGGTMQCILSAWESANQFRLVAGPTAPQLWITREAAHTVVISWAASAVGWALQESPTLAPGNWAGVSKAPVQVGDRAEVTLSLSTTRKFYRLAQVPPAPQLVIARGTADSVVISWPAPSTGWVLQENLSLAANTWTNSNTTALPVGGTLQVTVSPPQGKKFYRLKK
jgi:hypothetical protein